MSGSSGQGSHSVARDNSSFLSAADDQDISSLLSSSAWNGTNITFSFPTSSADYGATYSDPAPFNGFAVLTAQQQGEVLRAFSLIATYTNLTFTDITETTTTHAAIRLANSSSPPTSYAYNPSTAADGGDVFYGRTGQSPIMGNFDSAQATLHEIGHALGLKHGQDNNTYGVMNADRLDIEFSLMNYPNYIGSTDGFGTAAESPQSYMMYDIAAFQYMYGANFSQVGRSVTYTWSATTGIEFINGVSQGTPFDNHIFETVWTEGASSTYDLSNFSQDQIDDMNPGGWMDFSISQLADLNANALSKPQGEIFARGDIYNALEYNGDSRSLIDNIITGSGNDTIIGNAANNVIDGGGGTNTFVETGSHTNYAFVQLGTGYIQITDLRSGSPDGTDQIKNIQKIQFADGTYTIGQLLTTDTNPPFLVADNALTIAAGGGGTITSSMLRFDDNSSGHAQEVYTVTVGPTHGTLFKGLVATTTFTQADIDNGLIFYGENGNSLTPDSFTFTVTDASGNKTVPFPFQIQFTDQSPPSPVVDIPLTVTINGSNVITSNFLRFDDNSSNHAQETYTVLTGPTHGGLLKSGLVTTTFTQADIDNGLITYQETAAGVSSDSFTFKVADAAGNATATQTFQIQVGVILEAFGSTDLVQVGNGYFLDNSNLFGPQLKIDGAPWTTGEFGAWALIGAEATATGYEVAFKNGTSGLFTVWNTDANGNMISDSIGSVFGDSPALEALESSFRQDLNGDGTIGIPATTVIESFGSTGLAKSGNDYYLNSVSTGTGPELQYGGAAFVAGTFGGWTPIAAEVTASGYEVAFRLAGTSLYTVWNTDTNGNITTDPIGSVFGDSPALEALESSFRQDLNGDGTIGIPPTTVIESLGSTSLVKSGNDFYLNSISTGTGPALQYAGGPWTAGTFGAWAMIGAEATAGGYEVAFKLAGANLYTVWNTDTNGNITNDTLGSVAGNNPTLEGLETSFGQDLNGDGYIGIPPITTIEAAGSTSLVRYGNEFYINGTGPELQSDGAPFTAGEFGAFTPVGAEATASGYEVAFKIAASGLFTVWNTDTNGNLISDSIGSIYGDSPVLESLESSFHQDLNGDGTIGIPALSVIESFGSTSLMKSGNDFYLNSVSTGTGPELQYGGAAFVAGTFGSWSPIAAETMAAGYEVAFKIPGTSLYTIWYTDGNGNLTSLAVPGVFGNNPALEGVEASFHQDLNGDGTIGVLATTVIESFGATSLAKSGNYYLNGVNGTGPELLYLGGPWTAGVFGAYMPIGAEATASGYEVAFRLGSTNTFTVWNTDTNGNITNDTLGSVAGNNATFEGLETSFGQDLNGDGAIGVPRITTIESAGVTSLVQYGNEYYINGTGPELQYSGAPFTAGEFGAFTPVGAEATASGYEVAFKIAASGVFTVWNVDANGNLINDVVGSISGSNLSLEFLETSFHQDLNGDSTTGIPGSTLIESSGATSLIKVGVDYFMFAGSGLGSELKLDGAPWTAGEWGTWTPIGVEATASGYEVAFKLGASDLYTVWNADTNGNLTNVAVSGVAGSNVALQLLEVGFHQDLNSDGTIGIPGSTIVESFGATSLVQTGTHFFMYSNNNGAGPELQNDGVAWATGVWGGWTPIGAEATATGYEVAFKLSGADLYTVWNTDSSGNITSNAFGSTAGASASLQSIETSFHQDLNGDGVIGVPGASSAAAQPAPIAAPSSGNAILAGTSAADTFVFNAHFGNDTVTGFQPGVDQVNVDHTLFASTSDLFSHTADNAAGSAVVAIAADQSITFESVSKLVLQQHASDFHLM